MTEYKKIQIIKHALAYYISRDGAHEADTTAEKRLLAEVEERAELLRQRYRIPKKAINQSSGSGNHEDTMLMIEDILDTLVEVGNGVTDEQLHEAADKLFRVRDILEKERRAQGNEIK